MIDWTNSDDSLLIKLYNHDELQLLEICKILKRKCKDVIQRLIYLKIVKDKYSIRGSSNNTDNSITNNPITNTNIENNPTQKLRDTTNQIFDSIDEIIILYNRVKNIIHKIT